MSFVANIVLGSIVLLGLLSLVLWFVIRTIRKAEDPARMLFNWVLTVPILFLCIMAVPWFGPFGPFLIVACAVAFSIVWTPSLVGGLLRPLTGIFDGGNEPQEARPTYSTSESLVKRGRFEEAARAVGEQLERFPNDHPGQMLLAQIQAEHLKDLPAATRTIDQLCAQPGHAPRNVAYALNTLADWRLKYGADAEGARQALERIQELFPETELALRAAQRIAHLASGEMLLPHQERRKFKVAKGIENIGLIPGREGVAAPELNPETEASQLVQQLEQHPHDTEARERLAALYVSHYRRPDLAVEQIESLLEVPNHAPKTIVRWLNLLADIQVRANATPETVHATLQRIIDFDPTLAAAELARNRQALLHLEFKANEKSQTVKLGSYEQNIGLKRRLPH
jgi:tetratricopeptide (TPR) repeat protein